MARRTLWNDLADYLRDGESRRGWSLSAQDGIISTAGVLLGFVGAGADEETLLVAGQAAIVAGMLNAGGAKWSETATRRAAELKTIADERVDQRNEDDSEAAADRAILIAYYMRKGLAPALAEEVADELLIRSPLKATLEVEHGIVRLTSFGEELISGAGSALSYGLGAAIPLLIAWYVPLRIELMLVLFSVVVSLLIVSVAGARTGGLEIRSAVARTLIVAAVTIGISYFVGTIGEEI